MFKKDYYEANREKFCQAAKDYKWRLKLKMIKAYGGKCSCCGINEPSFLTLEHINKDGAEHKRKLGSNGGHAVWLDLKKRNWPQEGYTILCWNCNCSTKSGSSCAHKKVVPEPGVLSCLIY